MTAQVHALVGSSVVIVSLLVGVWALVSARRSANPSIALTVGALVGTAILTIQVLIGADLWFRVGARPIAGPLAYVHMSGPILALAGAIFHVFGPAKNRVRNYAIGMLSITGLGLLSYVIGEIGHSMR